MYFLAFFCTIAYFVVCFQKMQLGWFFLVHICLLFLVNAQMQYFGCFGKQLFVCLYFLVPMYSFVLQIGTYALILVQMHAFHYKLINRPGVAGAVLQTASSLIDSLSQ